MRHLFYRDSVGPKAETKIETFPKRLQESVDQLEADPDRYLEFYPARQRSAPIRVIVPRGRTPCQAFVDGVIQTSKEVPQEQIPMSKEVTA